jgi:putative ABC transport system permease protein
MIRLPGIRRVMHIDRAPSAVEHAVDDELQFHLDEAIRELVAQGYSPDEARREARRRFGDVTRTREHLASIDRAITSSRQRGEWFAGLGQDVRHAWRGLRHTPAFSAGVVLTLALGIGATTAMVGIVDQLLFRPPRYLPAPASVHQLYFAITQGGTEHAQSSMQYRRYRDVVDWSRSLDQVVAYTDEQLVVGRGEGAADRNVVGASASLWTMFGARPAIGRFYTATEDAPPASARVAVLSYAYWQSAYGGRRSVLDSTLVVGANRYRVIGVAPRGFNGFSLEMPAMFVPIAAIGADQFGSAFPPGGPSWDRTYSLTFIEVYARSRPGVSDAAVASDLTGVFRRSQAERQLEQPGVTSVAAGHPRAVLSSVSDRRGPEPGPESKVGLWLVGVSVIVLLIACANVANLLLARAIGRRRETAVRVALGAGRARLLRQVLTESIVLALIGGAGAVAVAQWGGAAVRLSFARNFAWTTVTTDPRILLFTAAVAVATGVITGALAGLSAMRGDLADALKAGAREGHGRQSVARTTLVLVQAALSVVLLVGAGLFVRSLRHVQEVDLGFDAEHLLWAQPQLRGGTLDSAHDAQLRAALVARADHTPGVDAATQMVSVPFRRQWDPDLFVNGSDSVARAAQLEGQSVSAQYFATVGTRILRGRPISTIDRIGMPLVTVVSESMAQRLWPAQDPIGKCMRLRSDTLPCFSVVGVAENIKTSSLGDEPQYQFYVSAEQTGMTGGLFVRTHAPASTQAELVRRSMQAIMPDPAYVRVTPMSEILDPALASWRLGARMFTMFGVLALIVASVGLYSVIAYGVARRTHEIGVRIALGASARRLVAHVVRQGLLIAGVGIVIGAVPAVLSGRWIAPLLFKESPHDPVVFGAVAIVILAVAVVASWAPAVRAAHVNPVEALRSD